MTKFFNLWVLSTLILFYFGQVDWPGAHQITALLVVLPCLAAFNIGSLAGHGVELPSRPCAPWTKTKPITTFLIIATYMATTDVIIRQVVGASIFSPSSYSLDFGEVYANFVKTSAETSGRGVGGGLIFIFKGILAVAILYILAADYLSRWLTVGLIAATMVASSMLRGTDKEFVDLAILLSVLYFFKARARIRLRYPIALATVVLGFFLSRRIERYGGNLPDCIAGGDICLSYDSFLATRISPSLELLGAFLSNYIVQGYEALSMAVSLPFEPNYGMGHLPVLKRALCSVAGIGCSIGDFQDKLSGLGWDTSVKWTSVYTVIANDIGWYLLPLYFLAAGFVFGVSEAQWRRQREVFSLVVCVLICIFIIYSSANMQLAVSFEWLIPALFYFSVQWARIFSVAIAASVTTNQRLREAI